MTKPTSVRFEPEFADRLNEASARSNVQKSRIVLEAVTRILDEYDQHGSAVFSTDWKGAEKKASRKAS